MTFSTFYFFWCGTKKWPLGATPYSSTNPDHEYPHSSFHSTSKDTRNRAQLSYLKYVHGIGEEASGERLVESEAGKLFYGIFAERDSLHDDVVRVHPVVQPLCFCVCVTRDHRHLQVGARRSHENVHLVPLLGIAEDGEEEDGVVQVLGYPVQSVIFGVRSSHESFQSLESIRNCVLFFNGAKLYPYPLNSVQRYFIDSHDLSTYIMR